MEQTSPTMTNEGMITTKESLIEIRRQLIDVAIKTQENTDLYANLRKTIDIITDLLHNIYVEIGKS